MIAATVLLLSALRIATAARILGIVAVPSYSHQVAFRPIFTELSLRGHQVTVLTTDPIKNASLTNLTEIDLHGAYDIWREHDIANYLTKHQNNPFKILNKINQLTKDVMDYEINHPEVQELIRNRNNSFDLIMVELMFLHPLAFSEVFRCPYIGIVSVDTTSILHNIMGNPAHPVIHPDPFMHGMRKVNFWERLANAIIWGIFRIQYYRLSSDATREIKEYFGETTPSVPEILDKIEMLFLSLNPAFYSRRPVSPATILFGGGTHLEALKPLPADIQVILDNATDGAVYFSIGSNAKSKDFPKETKEILMQAFEELPYTILWKHEDDELHGRPDNVKIAKWLPQQDVLRHPNVKVFITQGGAQSTEEAIYSHVPLVGMPFFADQQYNAKSFVMRGFGLSVDRNALDKDELKRVILEVATNPKYKNNMITAAKRSLDQPMSGLEKAVWWTEYVLRHKDTKHLRATAAKLSIIEYYLLDVIGFVLVVAIVAIYLVYRIAKVVFSVATSTTKKKKQKKQ